MERYVYQAIVNTISYNSITLIDQTSQAELTVAEFLERLFDDEQQMLTDAYNNNYKVINNVGDVYSLSVLEAVNKVAHDHEISVIFS